MLMHKKCPSAKALAPQRLNMFAMHCLLSPTEALAELVTPGHTVHKKKAGLQLHAGTPAAPAADEGTTAAHSLDLPTNGCCAPLQTPAVAQGSAPAAGTAIEAPPAHGFQAPCAVESCPSTATKQARSTTKTPAHAASAAKTPAAVRCGVQTPALAILSKAFSASPYAPTPVPYGAAQKAPGSSSAGAATGAASIEPRRTRAQSYAATGSAGAEAASSGKGGATTADAAAASAAAVSGGMFRRSSGRIGGAAVSGTPVPKFSLTSPSGMLPPASRTLNAASGGPQQLQLQPAATPAQLMGYARGAATAVTPATAPRSIRTSGSAQASSVLKRCSSVQSGGAPVNTPKSVTGLPNLLDLLAAASAGESSPDSGTLAAIEAKELVAAAAAAVTAAEATEHFSPQDVNMTDAGSGEDGTPKDMPAEQQHLPAAALATPGPQVVKALSGVAAADAGAAAGANAGSLPESAGSGRAHSGDSAGASAGGSGGSSGGSNRAMSAMRLKKLWRESHAAALAAAAVAPKPDSPAGNAAEGAAAAAAAQQQGSAAARPCVLDLSDPEPAHAAGVSRERSPDSLAVACCADLLLLAAAAEDGIAALAEADVAAAAASAAADQAQAARAANDTPSGDAAAVTGLTSPRAAATADAGGQAVKVAASKARRSSTYPGQHTKVAAARAAVSAAMPRQPHAVPAAPQRRYHLDSLSQLPPARTAHVSSTPLPAAAGQLSTAAADSAPAGQPLVSNCTSSLMLPPAAQMRLLQLQQQHGPASAAVVNPSRFHPVSAANARVPHILNPGQMAPPRTSHTGACVARAAGGAQQQQQQQAHTIAGSGADGKTAQAQDGAEQGPAAAQAVAAEATAASAKAAAAGSSGAAAALSSLCNSSTDEGVAAKQALEIAPLNIPPLLSDAECWRMAQSQPWLIEAVAAEARQFLLSSAAAAAAVSLAQGPALAAAAAGMAAVNLGAMAKAAALVMPGPHFAGVGPAGKQPGAKVQGQHSCSGVKGPAAAGAEASAAVDKQQQRQPLSARALQPRNC